MIRIPFSFHLLLFGNVIFHFNFHTKGDSSHLEKSDEGEGGACRHRYGAKS